MLIGLFCDLFLVRDRLFSLFGSVGAFFPVVPPLLRTLAQIRKRAVAAYTQADLYRLNRNDYYEAETDAVHGAVCAFLT